MRVTVFKTTFAGLLLTCVITSCAQPTHPNVERLADGTYLYRSGDQRSLFLVTDEGVIVTDPINADVAKHYREAISAITDQPVRFVVYSHYHWDRVSGAQIFEDEGAQVIAQEECAGRFEDNPNSAVVTPDITFTDTYEVALGGHSLDLYYFGPSHGDCLIVFHARPANLLQIVDLINPPRASFPEDPNVPYVKPHNLRQFFAALEALAAENGVTEIVASSVQITTDQDGAAGFSPATGPVSIIRDQASFWDAIYAAVDFAEAEGNVGIDSFVRLKTIDLTAFESYDNYEAADLPIIMRRFVGFYDMGR